MKKYFIFFLSIILLLGTILGYNIINIENSKKSTFSESGYILNNLSDRYYFLEDEIYTKTYEDKIVFFDTEGEEITVGKENFIHYSSGSVEALKEGVLLDLNNITADPIIYYNMNANDEIKKTSNRYIIKNLKEDIQFDQAIWKISDNKYIILSESIKIFLNSGVEKEIKDYIEIEYVDNEVLNVYNQEVSYQTISSNSFIELSDNIKLNLGTKIISQDNIDKMSLDNMVINSNDNVKIVNLNKEDKESSEDENEDLEDNGASDLPQQNNANMGTIGGANGGINQGTTNIGQPSTGDDQSSSGEETEFNPSEIEFKENNANEESVDETKTIVEPVFSVKEENILADSYFATIKIVDDDELLSPDDNVIVKIKNEETGKNVLSYEVPYGEFEFDIEMKNNLIPDTQYILTASAKYQVGESLYNKNFIYRAFATDGIGIELQKDGFTSNEMNFEILFDENTETKSAKIGIIEPDNLEEIKYSQKVEKDSITTVQFSNLKSDTEYDVVIYDIEYGENGDLHGRPEEDPGAWKKKYQFKTLKKNVSFDINSYVDKRNGNFNLYIENLNDENSAIQYYEYFLYTEVDGEKQLAYRNKKESMQDIVKVFYDESKAVHSDCDYELKVVATVYDNEKYIEMEGQQNGLIKLNMPAKAFPTIYWDSESKEVKATSIKGKIVIEDEAATINTDEKIKITYTDSLGNEKEYKSEVNTKYTRDEEGKIEIPIEVDKLKSADTYKFSVYATIDLGEKRS